MISDRCKAIPTRFFKQRKAKPVVVSAKRYKDIIYRSTMGVKRDKLAIANEDERYLQYLKEGHEALFKRFTNVGVHSFDQEKQEKLDQELKEAEIRERQVRLEDERTRKERILRANRILENLKAGQRALHHALVESETIYQRKYNETINREIAEDAQRQSRFDEMQCPETLIPACKFTEEELKTREQAKAIEIRTYFLKDLEERRQRKLEQREQDVFEGIVEREQYKCLHEEEKKAAIKLVKKNRNFCERVYRESLKDKAEVQRYENMCDQIDDRVLCVDVTMRRNMDKRHNAHWKSMQEKLIRDRHDRAIKICRLQQATKRQDQNRYDAVVEHYNDEVEMDEARRQCQIQELSRQRRAYQLVEQKQAKKKLKLEKEINRFKIAERLKNQETNKRFYITQKRRKDKATANLRNILHGQREEFLEKRHEEKMRMSGCVVNPNLQEDLTFMNDASKTVTKAREEGRPIYPIAKAVEIYRRNNQLEVEPEGQMVHRSKLRDYCWPGYHSKADLAYRQYEHRDECRKKQEFDRRKILNNCIKITKMAAEENPFKPCVVSCPVKCFQHRGMPPIESVDSFDACANVCYEDEPPVRPCPSHMQVIKSCKNDAQKESTDLECPNAPISPSNERISFNAGRDHPFIQVLSRKSPSRPSQTYRISRTDRTRTWR